MDWESVDAEAKLKATAFAGRHGAEEGTISWSDRYNGYHAGFMENAATLANTQGAMLKLEKKLRLGVTATPLVKLPDHLKDLIPAMLAPMPLPEVQVPYHSGILGNYL